MWTKTPENGLYEIRLGKSNPNMTSLLSPTLFLHKTATGNYKDATENPAGYKYFSRINRTAR